MVRVAIVLKMLRAKSSPDLFVRDGRCGSPLYFTSILLFKDHQSFWLACKVPLHL